MKLFRIRTVEYWPENFRRGARYFVGDGVMIWPVSETRYYRVVKALQARQAREAEACELEQIKEAVRPYIELEPPPS